MPLRDGIGRVICDDAANGFEHYEDDCHCNTCCQSRRLARCAEIEFTRTHVVPPENLESLSQWVRSNV